MFENTDPLGDDDLELDTSFTPIFSSTQGYQAKRSNDVPVEESRKKIKLQTTPHSKTIPLVRNANLDTSQEDSIYGADKVVKRIFPGPAGLFNDSFKNFTNNTELNFREKEDILLCSQRTLSIFAEGPWIFMENDFRTCNKEQLFEKYTIGWIKKKFSYKKVLEAHKAAFLAAVIQNLDTVNGKIPSVLVTLKDATGTIDATILHSFYKEKSQYLTTGSVVVLKQFGVLTSPEGHCLTITSNNLLVIYHLKEETGDSLGDSVEKIVLHDSNANEIWKEANSEVLVQNNSNTKNFSIKPQFSNICDTKLMSVEKNVIPKPVNILSISKNIKKSSTNNFILPTNKTIVNNFNSSININNCKNIAQNVKKKFDFKKIVNAENKNNIKENFVNSNTLSKNDNEFLKTMLEDIHTDSLFGEF